jgi:hypothetical protein
VHLLTINAFAARHAYLDSLRSRLPVAHSLALTLVAGPLGLASHLLTKAAVRAWRRRSGRAGAGRLAGSATERGNLQ